MKPKQLLTFSTLALVLSFAGQANAEKQVYQGKVGRTLAESKEWWPEPVKSPAGAPNVVWILLDDVGYGAASAFGGEIKTPTLLIAKKMPHPTNPSSCITHRVPPMRPIRSPKNGAINTRVNLMQVGMPTAKPYSLVKNSWV